MHFGDSLIKTKYDIIILFQEYDFMLKYIKIIFCFPGQN